MSRALLAAVATSAAVATWWWATRPPTPALGESGAVISIITPGIDLLVANAVIAQMERLAGDEVSLVLHTPGGCVASCVRIADALRHSFKRSTAIIPYMATSGGTLIALSATRLSMGQNATLSAVDPVIYGRRARHIPQDDKDGLHELGQEYESVLRRFMRRSLEARLATRNEQRLERALALFMGDDAPHEWPIYSRDVEDLGIPVHRAERQWANYVDARRTWWRQTS